MNRREFFKILGASAAAVAVPSLAFTPAVKASVTSAADILAFLAGKEYGVAVMVPGAYEQYRQWACEFLVGNAREYLPKGTVVEIRAGMPADYGRSRSFAWYTNPKIAVSEQTGLHALEIDRFGGYFSAGSVRL